MTNKRKGIADIMILMGMIIGIVLIFFDFTPFWAEGDTYRVVLHTHMYGMSNALDAAELYTETALDYSVYQAVYDALKGNNLKTVSDGDTIPTNEEIQESIKRNIDDNLARYTSSGYGFTQDYIVTLPRYEVSLQDESGRLRVTTSAGDANMVVTKLTQEYGMKEDIEMKRAFLPQGEYGIDYMKILEMGEGLNANLNPGEMIDSEITGAINQHFPSELDNNELKQAIQDSIGTILETDYKDSVSVQDVSISGFRESDESYNYDITVTLEARASSGDRFPVYDPSRDGVVMDTIGLVFLKELSYTVSSS
jgi:hypothetical protein